MWSIKYAAIPCFYSTQMSCLCIHCMITQFFIFRHDGKCHEDTFHKHYAWCYGVGATESVVASIPWAETALGGSVQCENDVLAPVTVAFDDLMFRELKQVLTVKMYAKFCWRQWGSLLPGLRMLDPPLRTPLTWAEIFCECVWEGNKI